MESLELSIHINTKLYNQPIEIVTHHPIFLSNSMPPISFSRLIAFARTFSAMLSRRGDSRNTSSVLYLRWKAFRFSPLSILTLGLPQRSFTSLRKSPFFLVCWVFYHKSVLGVFLSDFIVSIDMFMWFCPLFYWYDVLHWLIFRCWNNILIQ